MKRWLNTALALVLMLAIAAGGFFLPNFVSARLDRRNQDAEFSLSTGDEQSPATVLRLKLTDGIQNLFYGTEEPVELDESAAVHTLAEMAQYAQDLLGALEKDSALFGGGILRDLVVGLTPPRAFQDPIYLLVALGVSVVLFFPFVRRIIGRSKRVFDALMLIMDAAGLGIFTITGMNTATTLAGCTDPLLLVFVGLLTGTGGGVLRDILAGDMPYILRKHIYASASIAGGILYLLLQQVWQGAGAILTSVVVVIVIRCAAAHFEWNLPRAKTVWKSDE